MKLFKTFFESEYPLSVCLFSIVFTHTCFNSMDLVWRLPRVVDFLDTKIMKKKQSGLHQGYISDQHEYISSHIS